MWTIATTCSLFENCVFTDTNTGTTELDLRPISQLKLGPFYDGTYNYSYSICSNSLWCTTRYEPPQFVMVDVYQPGGVYPDECWWLAQWNDTYVQQPQYNQIAQTWQFPPLQGQTAGGCVDQTRLTYIFWECDTQVETAEIITVNRDDAKCEYNITVSSQYACPSTPPPYCKWYASDNVILDLTVFDNTVITAIDSWESEYIFAYTPCRNGSLCNDIEVMAKLDNITDDSCVSYLSIWDGDNNANIMPYYDTINKVWEFEYKNGQNCDNSLPSSFYVFWFCNPDEPNYNIKKAAKVAPCLYELEIETKVAC